MFKFLIIVIVFLRYYLCNGQVLQIGLCPEVESMKYFEMEKFLGTWYEMQRFPTWYEDYGQCAYKIFDYCGRRLEISHGYIKDRVEYVLHVNTTYAPGDEAVFTTPKSNIDPVGIPLVVVDTDYKDYAVIYGCKSDDLRIKYISAWILSRSYSLDEETLSKARDILVKRTSSSAVYLETVHHSPELCDSYWTAHVQAQYVNTTEVDEEVEGRKRMTKYYQNIDNK
ncbi:lopap-like [Aricia agestis]|uniref:lopap-like n=1 Tax=Aricia agestis TaxID=91739 RepID=UPI001C20B226|nr:lopap-like [Aricia agestis]